MSTKIEYVVRREEIPVQHCDFCDKLIGPAPLDKEGGYMLSTTIQASGDKRPLWFGVLCRECMDDLRARSGFDAR